MSGAGGLVPRAPASGGADNELAMPRGPVEEASWRRCCCEKERKQEEEEAQNKRKEFLTDLKKDLDDMAKELDKEYPDKKQLKDGTVVPVLTKDNCWRIVTAEG